MARSKRVTTKTGPYSKRTVTYSSKGVRVTNSNKPPGSNTRRTVSTNLSTGKMRTTYSRKLGGGWRDISSKTFSPIRKFRSSNSNSDFNLFSLFVNRKTESGETKDLNWWQWILLIIAAPFIWLLGLVMPFILMGILFILKFLALCLLAFIVMYATGMI
jgi:hypothetical protein